MAIIPIPNDIPSMTNSSKIPQIEFNEFKRYFLATPVQKNDMTKIPVLKADDPLALRSVKNNSFPSITCGEKYSWAFSLWIEPEQFKPILGSNII